MQIQGSPAGLPRQAPTDGIFVPLTLNLLRLLPDEGEDVDHLLLVEVDFGERAGRGGMTFAGAQEIDDLLVG
jgi:hypothetical protein